MYPLGRDDASNDTHRLYEVDTRDFHKSVLWCWELLGSFCYFPYSSTRLAWLPVNELSVSAWSGLAFVVFAGVL